MSDNSFLPHFITEDIYVIKEEASAFKTQESVSESVAEVAETTNISSIKPEPVKNQPTTELKAAAPQIEPEPPIAKEPEPVYLKPLPTEGNNLKHCLLLVESRDEILETELKALLAKIMSAVKRSMDDVLLVNIRAATSEQIEALLSEQNHRHLIAFGTSKVSELNETAPYQMKVVNRKVYLRADPLAAINTNVELKKALWTALKGMF